MPGGNPGNEQPSMKQLELESTSENIRNRTKKTLGGTSDLSWTVRLGIQPFSFQLDDESQEDS